MGKKTIPIGNTSAGIRFLIQLAKRFFLQFLNQYWGINENISPLQILERTCVMFLIVFAIIRITGMRSFRKNNPFDLVMVFLVGGILSRGVVGATPFFSALAGAIGVIVIHKLFLKLTLLGGILEKVIKGDRYLIYAEGNFLWDNMRKADVTKVEIYEDLRVVHQTDSLHDIDKIYVEKTGEISFVKKIQTG